MSDQRPFFELMPDSESSLPIGKQLFEVSELVGHTIKAAIEYPEGKVQCDLVLITATDCFLAISADSAGCCAEDGYELKVEGNCWKPDSRVLGDYLSPRDMLDAGVISKPQFDVLQELEDKKKAEGKRLEAERLRKKIAELEGGAA